MRQIWDPENKTNKTFWSRLKLVSKVAGFAALLPFMVMLTPVWVLQYIITGKSIIRAYFNIIIDVYLETEK